VLGVPAPKAPSDSHEWVSFADPDEERTWVFDVTFLTSSWTCIFGNGCQGVLTGPAEDLVQGCCSYGAHFIDSADRRRIEKIAKTLSAEEWQFKDKGVDGIARRNSHGEVVTKLVKGACIFLNRPGFEKGPGCALHQVAVSRGKRPLDYKPVVCWQLPLRREEAVAEDGHVTSTILQWDRQHWGAGGQEFHWWCTESHEAFVGGRPVYEEMHDELIEMIGKKIYRRLVAYLHEREERRSTRVALPHPAVRQRTAQSSSGSASR
jgi:hypothetical protein